MNRDDIRRAMKARRDDLSGILMAEMSVRICERLITRPEYKQAKRIMCYVSCGHEVQTGGLIRAAIHAGHEVYAPVIREGRKMDAVRIDPDGPMALNRYSIPEPVGGEPVDLSTLDLVIAPGLAFDRKGNRLGYGKGYYDRFLARCSCPAIALAYGFQIVPEGIKASAHDIPMRAVITEDEIIRCVDEAALE